MTLKANIFIICFGPNWDPKDINGGYTAGDKYMNSGKLYVAQFNFDEQQVKQRVNGLNSLWY